MPRYEAYLLRIGCRSGERNGQVAIRLEHLPDGDTLRFSNMAALLAHLCGELMVEDGGPPVAHGVDPPTEAEKGEVG